MLAQTAQKRRYPSPKRIDGRAGLPFRHLPRRWEIPVAKHTIGLDVDNGGAMLCVETARLRQRTDLLGLGEPALPLVLEFALGECQRQTGLF